MCHIHAIPLEMRLLFFVVCSATFCLPDSLFLKDMEKIGIQTVQCNPTEFHAFQSKLFLCQEFQSKYTIRKSPSPMTTERCTINHSYQKRKYIWSTSMSINFIYKWVENNLPILKYVHRYLTELCPFSTLAFFKISNGLS